MIDTGASAYLPVVGPEVYSGGGFPLIYDCVGRRSSFAQSLGFASPRGRIVVIGCAAEFKKLDLTFVWAKELRIRGAVGYGQEAWRGFCQGTQVTLEFDEGAYVGSSAYVFASVLNHFFALYTSINSFTQLVIKSTRREGVWEQWPPMVGDQTVL